MDQAGDGRRSLVVRDGADVTNEEAIINKPDAFIAESLAMQEKLDACHGTISKLSAALGEAEDEIERINEARIDAEDELDRVNERLAARAAVSDHVHKWEDIPGEHSSWTSQCACGAKRTTVRGMGGGSSTSTAFVRPYREF